MKIEILFPEIANLYGDIYNVEYLKASISEVDIINTSLQDTPYFCNHEIDMLYIGPMPDDYLPLAVSSLEKHKHELVKLIENDTLVLATGNSLELFGTHFGQSEKSTKGLGIFPYYSILNYNNRLNTLFLGEFHNIEIVGFKSQFSLTYKNINPFIKVKRGSGINPKDDFEGVNYHNFFGTYLLGPLLVLNPYFTKYLLALLGYENKLAFEEEAINAYNQRCLEYQQVKSLI